MPKPDYEESRARHARLMLISWLGLFAAALFYGGLAVVLGTAVGFEPAAPEQAALLRIPFILAAFGGLVAAVLIGRRLVDPERLRQLPLALEGSGDAEQQTVLGQAQTAFIAQAALGEAPALLGLVLFFLGGSMADFLPLLLLSLLFLLAWVLPRREYYLQLADEIARSG